MTPERWRQLDELYDQVKDLPAAERDAALASADSELRASLLAILEQTNSALEQPLWAEGLAAAEPSLAGTRIGAYRIEEVIGAGGIGEVYRALDTRLGRTVAIKVLSPDLTSDPTSRRRLLHEARAISALSHPNIVVLYDILMHERAMLLVMEYVAGGSLKDLIQPGGMDLGLVLRLGASIASALGAAHEAGIVHRDVKPANILVTGKEQVKVLDFGIAKTAWTDAASNLTPRGQIIGTVSYMSPEQTRGEAVDARSDVFSLGCLLYEAATGQQPFTGLSAVAVMHQIATVEPAPPSSLRAGIPAAWDAVISKCLRKAPEERYASMNALEADLRLLDSAPRAAAPAMQLAGTRFGRKTLLLALGAALAAVALAAGLWLQKTEYFWRDPIAGARFQTVAELDGIGREAAVSRDGQFVAFLSGRDGQMDVWLTQIGSGQFHNLTQGAAKDIVNHELRSPGFSPDGSLVTFWARQPEARGGGGIDVWASPTLGGSPRLYLAGGAEFDWSRDGSRLVYHLSGPGDPMFVSDGVDRPRKAIFAAPNGTHCHFPLWSPDMAFIYFVQGTFPDKLDIWRMPATGGRTERITGHNSRVTYPVFLDKRTLLYLASDAEGSGPWLYSMDIDRRISHRLGTGLDRYTSLAASADGRRLVLTRATPQRSLWKLRLGDTPAANAQAARIPLTTAAGSSPRLGPGYLLYVSGAGASESLWKIAGGSSTELWTGQGARIAGGPAISPDGMRVAFTVRRREGTLLYTIQANGMHPRIVSDSLDLVGDPAWAPDGQSITAAVQKNGAPALYRVPLDGSAPTRLAQEYSVDPAWAPGGDFAVYSGPDVGTTFPLSALTPGGTAYPLPPLNLTRGARHVVVLSSRELVLLRGEMEHKDLWLADLKTGATRQLSNFPTDFNVRDFDIGPDGREVVLDLEQERSDVVSLDLPRR